eukprot:6151204-Karenia_brevis.AAC.1
MEGQPSCPKQQHTKSHTQSKKNTQQEQQQKDISKSGSRMQMAFRPLAPWRAGGDAFDNQKT